MPEMSDLDRGRSDLVLMARAKRREASPMIGIPMIRFLLALALLAALQATASAQSLVSGTTNLPASCASLGTDASSPPKLVCNPTPPSSVTVAGGACVTVSAGPAYVVSLNAVVKPHTASYPFAPTDNCGSFPYTGTAAANYTMPLPSTIQNGWGVAIGTTGAGGTLTLVQASGSTAKFYGGPTVFSKGQGATIQFDGTNFWILPGVSSAIANANPFN
jgi:hypothetical protein